MSITSRNEKTGGYTLAALIHDWNLSKDMPEKNESLNGWGLLITKEELIFVYETDNASNTPRTINIGQDMSIQLRVAGRIASFTILEKATNFEDVQKVLTAIPFLRICVGSMESDCPQIYFVKRPHSGSDRCKDCQAKYKLEWNRARKRRLSLQKMARKLKTAKLDPTSTCHNQKTLKKSVLSPSNDIDMDWKTSKKSNHLPPKDIDLNNCLIATIKKEPNNEDNDVTSFTKLENFEFVDTSQCTEVLGVKKVNDTSPDSMLSRIKNEPEETENSTIVKPEYIKIRRDCEGVRVKIEDRESDIHENYKKLQDFRTTNLTEKLDIRGETDPYPKCVRSIQGSAKWQFQGQRHQIVFKKLGTADSFGCFDCGYTFDKKYRLINHMKLHKKRKIRIKTKPEEIENCEIQMKTEDIELDIHVNSKAIQDLTTTPLNEKLEIKEEISIDENPVCVGSISIKR